MLWSFVYFQQFNIPFGSTVEVLYYVHCVKTLPNIFLETVDPISYKINNELKYKLSTDSNNYFVTFNFFLSLLTDVAKIRSFQFSSTR